MVEASLGLAGFAGVVTALARRGVGELPPLHRLNLVNLLATAFSVLFLSLIALVMLAAGIAESFTWRVASGIGLLGSFYFGLRSYLTIVKAIADSSAQNLGPSHWFVNAPLALVAGIQVWNVIYLGAFWPVLTLLTALLAIGCFSFVRLLIAPAV